MKELSMSGSGILWANFEQICERNQGFFNQLPARQIEKFFQSNFLNYSVSKLRSKWGIIFQSAPNLPLEQCQGKLIKNSQKTLNLPWE